MKAFESRTSLFADVRETSAYEIRPMRKMESFLKTDLVDNRFEYILIPLRGTL